MDKRDKDFGSFRITADGRVLVADLALIQAIRSETQQVDKVPQLVSEASDELVATLIYAA